MNDSVTPLATAAAKGGVAAIRILWRVVKWLGAALALLLVGLLVWWVL